MYRQHQTFIQNQENMHKRMLLTILSICVVAVVNAQQGRIWLGVHAGAGLVLIRGNEIMNDLNKSDLRFSTGVVARFNLKNNFFINTNLNYESKGSGHVRMIFTDPFGSNPGMGEASTVMKYLVLPVRAGKEFGKKIKFNVQAGMYGALLLNEWIEIKFDDGRGYVYEDQGQYAKTDFGISAGLGMHFPAGKKCRIQVEVTDDYGLQNIYRGPADVKVRTQSANLRVGILRRF